MKVNPDPQLTGYLRLPQVLKLYPVSRGTWWTGVRTGRYPAAVKLGPRCSAWRVEDIRRLIDNPEGWEKQAGPE